MKVKQSKKARKIFKVKKYGRTIIKEILESKSKEPYIEIQIKIDQRKLKFTEI